MRFLLDSMLGKLTRWLRILGYDSQYLRDASDNHLLSQAKHESRILLTSDTQLYRTAISRGVSCFLISTQSEPERLAHLAHRFNMNLKLNPSTSRCPLCGSAIKPVKAEEILGDVPPETIKLYKRFWTCTNRSCAKVYWHGSHWKNIEETIRSASEILERKRKHGTGDFSVPFS